MTGPLILMYSQMMVAPLSVVSFISALRARAHNTFALLILNPKFGFDILHYSRFGRLIGSVLVTQCVSRRMDRLRLVGLRTK